MSTKQKELDENGLVIRPNKTVEKRKREEVKSFVKDLLELANDKYDDLPISDTLKKALIEAKRLKNNAFNRHLSFVARLIVELGLEDIQSAYKKIHHAYRNDPQKIRETENYRNRLIYGDKEVLNELLSRFLEVDIQYIRQLSRNANKEIKPLLAKAKEAAQEGETVDVQKIIQSTKSSKLLYRYLFKLELI